MLKVYLKSLFNIKENLIRNFQTFYSFSSLIDNKSSSVTLYLKMTINKKWISIASKKAITPRIIDKLKQALPNKLIIVVSKESISVAIISK